MALKSHKTAPGADRRGGLCNSQADSLPLTDCRVTGKARSIARAEHGLALAERGISDPAAPTYGR